jgi:hypothetical protein
MPLPEAQRRWAELLRQIFEADPLAYPQCGGPMRILAFVTHAAMIAQIHLRRRPSAPAGPAARSPPARPAAKIPTR